MSMNWDDILKAQEEDAGFGAVPAGKYTVRVVKGENVKASTGADMVKVEMEIEGGPYAGRKLWTNIVFTVDNPNAMRFTIRKLNGLGITKEIISTQKPTPAQIASMIVGVVSEAEVEVRQYNDEDRNDVKMFKRLDATAAAPAPKVSKPGVPNIPTPPAPTPEPEAAEADSDADDDEEPF